MKFVFICLLIPLLSTTKFTGPTKEGALEKEKQLAAALLANNADAVDRLLTDDWTVISAHGKVAAKQPFLDVIRSGQFSRKTYELAETSVKLYGNTAIATTRVQTSGTFMGKGFDLAEMETDVLIWVQDDWKFVQTHETKIVD